MLSEWSSYNLCTFFFSLYVTNKTFERRDARFPPAPSITVTLSFENTNSEFKFWVVPEGSVGTHLPTTHTRFCGGIRAEKNPTRKQCSAYVSSFPPAAQKRLVLFTRYRFPSVVFNTSVYTGWFIKQAPPPLGTWDSYRYLGNRFSVASNEKQPFFLLWVTFKNHTILIGKTKH